VDKDQPILKLVTMEEFARESVTLRRVSLILLIGFALLALTLAAIGIYAVVSYSVAQRAHEIGIRMALGATRGEILKMVVGQGIELALIGVGIGIAAGLGLTRFLSSLLFGVQPTDPETFLAVAIVLLGLALLATYIPARRATKVDAIVALRYE
jgi:putative ABC transport system permease protein